MVPAHLAAVLLALEVLVLVVAEPVVRVPLFEGVSVHRVGGDVAVKDWLLFYLVIIYKSFSQKLSRYTELLAWMTFYPAYFQFQLQLDRVVDRVKPWFMVDNLAHG